MSEFDYDLFVIGAGSGGVRAARISASHGARVAICEESRVGGTCVIRGCVPKKLLVYGSHYSEHFEDAREYGWDVQVQGFDWPRLIANKDREIDRLNAIYLKLLDDAGVELIEGRGKITGSHQIQVGSRTVTAEKILIATGSRPYVPEFPGSEHVIHSDHAFHLPELPKRVVVVGGGYIACEFAGIFNGMGAEVSQVYRGDVLLRGFDDDVRATVTEAMAARGVQLHLECTVQSVAESDAGFEVHLGDGSVVEANCVMYATGRSPYSWDLGLEEAGVETDMQGAIVVDEYSRTSVANIFAVGDVTNRINLTPVAIHEGHAFADTEFGGKPRACDHRYVASAVFSQPPVGSVGYSEAEARQKFSDIRVYQSSFRPMKHTMTGRRDRMLMKLVVDAASDKVVGCHVVGDEAAEIVQGFAVAVKAGLTKAQFDATIGIHPTAAEELVTMRVVKNTGK